MIGGDEDGAGSASQTLRHQARIIAFHDPLVAKNGRVVKGSEFRFRALLPIGMGQMMKLIEMDCWKAKFFGKCNRQG